MYNVQVISLSASSKYAYIRYTMVGRLLGTDDITVVRQYIFLILFFIENSIKRVFELVQ